MCTGRSRGPGAAQGAQDPKCRWCAGQGWRRPGAHPRLLALVGDAADGYPGLAGIGPIDADRLINKYGALEDFPSAVLGKERELALLFKELATLRSDAPLFANVEELRWRGPTEAFSAIAAYIGDERLLTRCLKVALNLPPV